MYGDDIVVGAKYWDFDLKFNVASIFASAHTKHLYLG